VVITIVSVHPIELQERKLSDIFLRKVLESRDRLQIVKIDILLLHNPPDDSAWSDFDTDLLFKLQQDRTISTLGVSCQGLKGAVNVAQSDFGTVIEWVYNVFERRPKQALFNLCKRNNINFITRSPLSRGLINEKYLNIVPTFPVDDFRYNLPSVWLAYTLEQLRKFQQNGLKSEDISERAIAFCCAAEEVTAVIPSIKSKNQLRRMIEIRDQISEFPEFDDYFLHNIPMHYDKWS
jgi:aryl-alcohol dehydrogenase-like predicted oxidoreductase